MNTSNMKNIVILKDLPSNLVEEAIIFLKENSKQRKLEFIEDKPNRNNENINILGTKNEKDKNEYIVNEAKMIVSDYISKEENKYNSQKYIKLKQKYKKQKKLSIILSICFSISIILNFVI